MLTNTEGGKHDPTPPLICIPAPSVMYTLPFETRAVAAMMASMVVPLVKGCSGVVSAASSGSDDIEVVVPLVASIQASRLIQECSAAVSTVDGVDTSLLLETRDVVASLV